MARCATVARHVSALALALSFAPSAIADYTLRCASAGHPVNTCRLSESGYVRLDRQISHARCEKGRTWDYDSREIWVSSGCEADFSVQTHSDHRKNSDAAAVGVLIGAAVLAAAAESGDRAGNKPSRYSDEQYQGSRHTSYVPGWMIGTFRGFNGKYNADVTITIDADGRATARVADRGTVQGYVNDHQLIAGGVYFDIDRTAEGFVTSQRGDRSNEVRYRRLN